MEAPSSERSFLAWETERVFEPSIGSLGTSLFTVLGMLPPDPSISKSETDDVPSPSIGDFGYILTLCEVKFVMKDGKVYKILK